MCTTQNIKLDVLGGGRATEVGMRRRRLHSCPRSYFIGNQHQQRQHGTWAVAGSRSKRQHLEIATRAQVYKAFNSSTSTTCKALLKV
jgi:hypothetical protein